MRWIHHSAKRRFTTNDTQAEAIAAPSISGDPKPMSLFASFAAWTGTAASSAVADDIAFGISIVLDGVEAYLRRRGALPDAS